MRKFFITLLIVLSCLPAMSQSCYWVFLTDKHGVTFDPYSYFDAKAIERYRLNGADLNDITNYPLDGSYVSQINAIATEEIGQSRWLNAMAVMATPDQISQIEQLAFVSSTQLIANEMQLASHKSTDYSDCSDVADYSESSALSLSNQLLRMQGDLFRQKGIDGKGIRIAVFDGGFPRVNTHRAFKHLRDSHRILDTWNFPNKKADVYGWNSHGLSTLSCITGIVGNQQLGLATGAEFLLYRTEVEAEPFKEEVWWMQAVERADQHGANLISSSLGYGKERYFTKDMDGTSYVAKAANMAARKGILVVNSAGNEADTRQWKTIITPADADSVLCVGGIESDNEHYRHIDFSSYGPSADGRLKPNVSAYGHALAATNGSDSATGWVYGTSFSCPLTSGFAACAWQLCSGKTAMEMMDLIQKSADLYPYFDYALGYGVPQASYFVNGSQVKAPTFQISQDEENVYVNLLEDAQLATIFSNLQRPDGGLEHYSSVEYSNITTTDTIGFSKAWIDSNTLNISYNGYTVSYRLQPSEIESVRSSIYHVGPYNAKTSSSMDYDYVYNRLPEDLVPEKWGKNAEWEGGFYLMYGLSIPIQANEKQVNFWSPTFHVGYRVMHALSKAYKIGLGLEYVRDNYNYPFDKANRLDNLFNVPQQGLDKKCFSRNELGVELFQRVRIVPSGGLFANGVHWDLGVYGSYGWSKYALYYDQISFATEASREYRNPSFIDNYRFNWGLTTRITYDWIGVYARYRMTHLTTSYDVDPFNPTSFKMEFPRLEVGLQICF